MKTIILVCGLLVTVSSFAKLPTLSEEAKAKAAEAKAKTGWSDKVAAFQLCKAQDKVAAQYLKAKAAPTPGAPAGTAPCVDPGPYVAAPIPAATPPAAAVATAPATSAGSAPSATKK